MSKVEAFEEYRDILFEKLSSRTLKTETCWLWTGTTVKGYGRISISRGGAKYAFFAHRLAWAFTHGTFPAQYIDHLCRNRACINPFHMEDVSSGENVLRGESFSALNARKTSCIHGHAFTAANTMLKKLGRECRACHRKRMRLHYYRKLARVLQQKEKP